MWKLIKRFTLKNWLFTAAILLLTVAQVYFTMVIVDEIGTLTNLIVSKPDLQPADVWWHGLAMIISALAITAVQIISQFFSSAVAADVVSRERENLYKKVNELALSELNEFSIESLITRCTNDMQNVHISLLTALRTIFLCPVTMIWAIIKLATTTSSGPLSIATLVWLLLLVIVVIVLVIVLIPKFKVIQTLTDNINITSRENLTGVRVVRAFNAEKYQEKKFDKVNTEYTKTQIFAGRIIAFFTPFVNFILFGLTLSILWISAILASGADLPTSASIFSNTNPFIMLAAQIIMSFVMLVVLIVLLPRALISCKRINEVLEADVSIKDPVNPVKEFKEEGTIEFRNVGFTYKGAAGESVSDITFKVNKGETIAFIGATGSGKTTIINMIPRLADATRGEVLVDGVNVKDVTQDELRSKIGYTPQRGFLFKGTIKQNLMYANPDMSVQEMVEAAKVADADSFVTKKRNQYDSEVAQGGTNFSGGQKQRLCIARSIAKRPEILIFDDSFSALDYQTDKNVRANIKKALPDTTRVIIAQRVGTIMDADQIVVLDKGKMVGIGKHKDLVKNCPVYQEIALSQMSKEELGL